MNMELKNAWVKLSFTTKWEKGIAKNVEEATAIDSIRNRTHLPKKNNNDSSIR